MACTKMPSYVLVLYFFNPTQIINSFISIHYVYLVSAEVHKAILEKKSKCYMFISQVKSRDREVTSSLSGCLIYAEGPSPRRER